eukprot:GHVT01042911.1.p1 GENE.GHVT01042911.1~~GHVT01042911.1.p1  ORF type:complete len:190 (-),score=24.78 GHVT01042911.1:636-1205(-)
MCDCCLSPAYQLAVITLHTLTQVPKTFIGWSDFSFAVAAYFHPNTDPLDAPRTATFSSTENGTEDTVDCRLEATLNIPWHGEEYLNLVVLEILELGRATVVGHLRLEVQSMDQGIPLICGIKGANDGGNKGHILFSFKTSLLESMPTPPPSTHSRRRHAPAHSVLGLLFGRSAKASPGWCCEMRLADVN